MKIAFFDSGIGGLTVLHEAVKQLPHEEYIYYADSSNIPYGIKSSKEIKELVFEAVGFLIKKNIDALVIACNTATSVVVKELRNQYTIPIIGMEPALKPALTLNDNKQILLCATNRTLKEDKLKRLIENTYSKGRVEMRSLQPLVQFAEDFKFSDTEVKDYLNETLKDIKPEDFGSIVLGCTHFLFYRPFIRTIIHDSIQILDGNRGTVNRLKSMIEPSKNTSSLKMTYYSSDYRNDEKYFQKYLDYYNSIQTLEL